MNDRWEKILNEFAILNFAYLIFLYIALIPKTLGLPFAPKYICMALGILLFLLKRDKKFIFESIGMLDFVLLFVFYMVFVYVTAGSYASAVKFVEGILFTISGAAAVNNDPKKAQLFTKVIAGVFVLSAFWFLASLWVGDPFLYWHQLFYASNFAEIDRSNALQLEVYRPTGFVFNHFTFGYQMAAGMVLVGLIALIRRNTLWTIFFLIVSIAAILSGQRSVIPAVIVSLLLFFLFQDLKKAIVYIAIFAVVMFLTVLGVNKINKTFKNSPWRSVFQKYTEKKDDVSDRLSWQIAAVKVIFKNPLGTSYENKDWSKLLKEAGATYRAYQGTVFYIHNGYIMYIVRYGWLMIVITGGIILLLWRKLFWLTRHIHLTNARYAMAAAFATISVFFQALFHNSSLYSNEPSTWAVFSLLCIWLCCLRNEQKKTLPDHQAQER